MKIAFDYQTFTYQSYGGISRYYTSLADRFSKQGEDIRVFAGMHRNSYLSNLPEGVVYGHKLEKYPPKTGRLFKVVNHAISQIQMKNWKPDVVHETYYSSLPVLSHNAARVTSVYDMIHELFAEQFPRDDQTTKWKKESFQRCDKIISISESTKRDLVRLFDVDEKKVSVVHLGVDFSVFQQLGDDEKFEDRPYILYVGARGGYKNFDLFLSACSQSKLIKNKIKIYAFGGGAFNNAELQIIREYGFADDYVQQISGGDDVLVSLYKSALFLVYPSLYEGFGLPPLEAMAAGCPVISSDTSSMPEVINNAALFFNPFSLEEMRSAIDRAIIDSALRDQLIQAGYNNILRFSWEKCGDETLAIYREITGKV